MPGKAVISALAAAALLLAAGCATVPYTERRQFMMVSEAREEQIGEALFAQVKEEALLSDDPSLNSIMTETGERIAEAAGRTGIDWEFIVIESPAANAFALPGGKVAFYSGIMPICEDEAGVAAVMGHEVAHVIARHGAERMSQKQALFIGQSALMAALLGRSPIVREGVMQAYGLGAQVGVLLPYSRSHELEADRIGLILMAKAGYDPAASIEFWERMLEGRGGEGATQFLSTHPGYRQRIDDLRSFLPEAMGYYRQALEADPGLRRPPRRLGQAQGPS